MSLRTIYLVSLLAISEAYASGTERTKEVSFSSMSIAAGLKVMAPVPNSDDLVVRNESYDKLFAASGSEDRVGNESYDELFADLSAVVLVVGNESYDELFADLSAVVSAYLPASKPVKVNKYRKSKLTKRRRWEKSAGDDENFDWCKEEEVLNRPWRARQLLAAKQKKIHEAEQLR